MENSFKFLIVKRAEICSKILKSDESEQKIAHLVMSGSSSHLNGFLVNLSRDIDQLRPGT